MVERGQPLADLKRKYTDRQVRADASVPELARFAGKLGRVVTINANGRALVDFRDGPWYDIHLSNLTLVDPPESSTPVAS